MLANEVEQQLARFVAGFSPNAHVREGILRRLATDGGPESGETIRRRKTLERRLRRMRDLYELGDLPRGEYLARRNAINAELNTLAPEPIPDLADARSVLQDFTTFWSTETEPDAKRQFLTLIFEGVWLDERRVVAVQPKPSFLPFFETHAGESPETMGRKVRERRGSGPVITQSRNRDPRGCVGPRRSQLSWPLRNRGLACASPLQLRGHLVEVLQKLTRQAREAVGFVQRDIFDGIKVCAYVCSQPDLGRPV